MAVEDNRGPIIVIEHCEKDLSPWLLIEYRHASIIIGRDRLWFTNTPSKYHKILSRYGVVREESIVKLVWMGLVNPSEVIVLDPQAPTPLTYDKLVSARYVVIGGILGDHPPRGRTKMLITDRMPKGVFAYNIGDGQYSIDGSVYYVKYMLDHKGLDGYRYVDGVEINTGSSVIYLPYRYPIVNGKPLISRELIYYLTHRALPEEVWSEIKNTSP